MLIKNTTGSVVTLIINRPEVMNAMSSDLAEALLTEIENISAIKGIRSIVIMGSGGKAFCAGTDLKERITLNADEKWKQSRRLFALNEVIWNCPLPVIAAIDGWCLGGGFELALYCDIRVGTFSSTFGWPEMTLGAYPGGGGAVILPRLIGIPKAKYLFYTAQRIHGQEAYDLGILERVVESNYLINVVNEITSNIEKTSPLGISALKKSINGGANLLFDDAVILDQELRRPLESTNDYQEGLKAHKEKRKPIFKGE